MSYVIQIFLPVYTAKKRRIPSSKFVATRKELTEKFGGLTAYSRAPAQGLWKKDDKTVRDDIVVFEVMVGSLAPRWWAAYNQAEAAVRSRRGANPGFRQSLPLRQENPLAGGHEGVLLGVQYIRGRLRVNCKNHA